MRRVIAVLAMCLFCVACAAEDKYISPALEFRTALIQAKGCSFVAEVTADFGKTVQIFTMDCESDAQDAFYLTVLEPETLKGITATVKESGGQITYDGLAMDFGLLANGNVIPAAAPAIVAACWTDEYISAAGEQGEEYRVTYEKNFDENRLIVDTWFKKGVPICAEICYNNQRIIKITIRDFSFN